MLKILDIQNELIYMEQGMFQKICNEILCFKGYIPYKYTGSAKGTNKTKGGTPDSVYIDNKKNYVYVEITTQKSPIDDKIEMDVRKCLKKIEDFPILKNKISKIIFLHNNPNIEEHITENIKEICGNINFEIYGLEHLSNLLQNECKDIAISEMHIKDDALSVNSLSQEALNQIANAVNQNKVLEYKDNTIDEIKSKINNLYKEAELIINNEDATIRISDSSKSSLKRIYDSLSVFDFYYARKNNDDSKIYYHNMLVISSRYDSSFAIEYFEKMPNFAKNNLMTLHYYSLILIDNCNYPKANDISKKLYHELHYEPAFETLNRTYFLLENYDDVIALLSSSKKEKFDKSGFLASMLIISKNYKKQYSESEILKLNSSKFNKMPLFYFCTSKMLYDLDKRKKRYREQLKKGLRLLNEKDVVAIFTMCNQAKEMNLEEEAINYLESISLTPLLQAILLELLTKKINLTKLEIELINNINQDDIPSEIDLDYLNAKIIESKGKELEAIKMYKNSFTNKQKLSSAYKYIQLSIKNKSQIDEEIVYQLVSNSDNLMILMIAVDAFRYIGKYDEAVKYSYRAIYLAKGNNKYQDTCRQFWYTLTLIPNKSDNIEFITNDCVVILKNGGKNKIILLEDDNFFLENDTILGATIFRTYSNLGISLLHLKKGDKIIIDNNDYKICEIHDKYSYFARSCFKFVEKSKNVKTFTTSIDNPDDFIEQIKHQMIEINKYSNYKLDVYQNNKKIPLSSLLSEEYNFEEYAKLINTILSEKERILLTGERKDVELSNGFIIDVTSLIVLSLFDLLCLIPNSLYKKIYITASLKNKFQYFYKSLIRNHDNTETSIYITENNELVKDEIPVINQIKFWQKLDNFIGKINIVEIEAEKDEIINNDTYKIFDKVQFDTIKLAKTKNLPFVCDDLTIRRFAEIYGIKHTNSLQIIYEFSNDFNEYITNFNKFSKCNYIYTLFFDDLSLIIKKLYNDYNDNNKEIFLNVIKSVLENKASLNCYIPILLERIENMKKVQYIKIFDEVYEILLATFFIESVSEEIKNACEKFGVSLNSFK